MPSWILRRSASTDAQRRTEKALTLFEEAVGLFPLGALTKAVGARFVRFLLDAEKCGFGNKTANNHAGHLNALMTLAVQDDLIERNPFDLSIDKRKGARKREAWTDAELRTIYGSALFSSEMHAIPQWDAIAPEDARAVLLTLQHTGARSGEIAQLRRGDVENHNGVIAIRITAEAGTVKTVESERRVPLAGHLLRDPWFSQWIKRVMDGSRPSEPAMPSLHGRAASPADMMGKWFLEFRKMHGLYGTHRYRHWMRTALAAKGINESKIDAITGHAGQGSAGRTIYTGVMGLPALLDALDCLSYPEICAGPQNADAHGDLLTMASVD